MNSFFSAHRLLVIRSITAVLVYAAEREGGGYPFFQSVSFFNRYLLTLNITLGAKIFNARYPVIVTRAARGIKIPSTQAVDTEKSVTNF